MAMVAGEGVLNRMRGLAEKGFIHRVIASLHQRRGANRLGHRGGGEVPVLAEGFRGDHAEPRDPGQRIVGLSRAQCLQPRKPARGPPAAVGRMRIDDGAAAEGPAQVLIAQDHRVSHLQVQRPLEGDIDDGLRPGRDGRTGKQGDAALGMAGGHIGVGRQPMPHGAREILQHP